MYNEIRDRQLGEQPAVKKEETGTVVLVSSYPFFLNEN